MSRKCRICSCNIPNERLEILPETDTCVEHSDVESYVGFMVYQDKCTPEFVAINPKNKEALRLARAADERER